MSLRGVAQLGPVCRVGPTLGTAGFSWTGLEPRGEGWKARLVRNRKAGGGMSLRGVAQLVARLVRDQEVRGSSPRTPIFIKRRVGFGGCSNIRKRSGCVLGLPRDPGTVRPVANVSFGASHCSWRAKRVSLAHAIPYPDF
jgi:hypothetical protein